MQAPQVTIKYTGAWAGEKWATLTVNTTFSDITSDVAELLFQIFRQVLDVQNVVQEKIPPQGVTVSITATL